MKGTPFFALLPPFRTPERFALPPPPNRLKIYPFFIPLLRVPLRPSTFLSPVPVTSRASARLASFLQASLPLTSHFPSCVRHLFLLLIASLASSGGPLLFPLHCVGTVQLYTPRPFFFGDVSLLKVACTTKTAPVEQAPILFYSPVTFFPVFPRIPPPPAQDVFAPSRELGIPTLFSSFKPFVFIGFTSSAYPALRCKIVPEMCPPLRSPILLLDSSPP